MNNKAIVKDEGVVMNTNLNFGNPFLYSSRFNSFLKLELTMWDLEYDFYYRITDDNYIQLVESYENKEFTICAQFTKVGEDLKSNLSYVLTRYIEVYLMFDGYPRFVECKLFTRSEFNIILSNFKNEIRVIKSKAKKRHSPLIGYLRKLNFKPEPTGNTEYSWVIGCPNANKKHFLMISTLNDEWGCGYCKKKGKIDEFKLWLHEIKVKNYNKKHE